MTPDAPLLLQEPRLVEIFEAVKDDLAPLIKSIAAKVSLTLKGCISPINFI